jgi:hypothetical protein
MKNSAQFDIERMAGPVSHQVTDKIMAHEGQVSSEVEDFVPRRLVGVAQPVFNRPPRAKDQEIRIGHALSQALSPQLGGFRFKDKGSAIG